MPSKRVLSTAVLLIILVSAIIFVGVMVWWHKIASGATIGSDKEEMF